MEKNPIGKKSVVLTVRVDYYTDGRDDLHANTAARMVVNDQFHTIENGVEIERVEVFGNDGDEWFVYDNTGRDIDTPRCYRVHRDKKTGDTTVWDDCAGVGLRFHHGDTLARYNSELIARTEYTRTEEGLEELAQIRDALTDYAAKRFPYNFGELNTTPIS